MTDLLQVPAHFKKVESKSTGAWRMLFETIDYVEPEKINKILTLNNKDGFVLFAERKLEVTDLVNLPKMPEVKKTDGKPPSQRLRAVMFKLHKQLGGKDADFEGFYITKMEAIIDHFKDKLE